jgi:hypothetical protein
LTSINGCVNEPYEAKALFLASVLNPFASHGASFVSRKKHDREAAEPVQPGEGSSGLTFDPAPNGFAPLAGVMYPERAGGCAPSVAADRSAHADSVASKTAERIRVLLGAG